MQDTSILGFDEETYLACNPDVQHAVAVGQFSSGFDLAVPDGLACAAFDKRFVITCSINSASNANGGISGA